MPLGLDRFYSTWMIRNFRLVKTFSCRKGVTDGFMALGVEMNDEELNEIFLSRNPGSNVSLSLLLLLMMIFVAFSLRYRVNIRTILFCY